MHDTIVKEDVSSDNTSSVINKDARSIDRNRQRCVVRSIYGNTALILHNSLANVIRIVSTRDDMSQNNVLDCIIAQRSKVNTVQSLVVGGK